jgi:hypothetical protein
MILELFKFSIFCSLLKFASEVVDIGDKLTVGLLLLLLLFFMRLILVLFEESIQISAREYLPSVNNRNSRTLLSTIRIDFVLFFLEKIEVKLVLCETDQMCRFPCCCCVD